MGSVYSTVNSTTEAMKRNSPNLSTVNDAYRSTYDLGAKAVYAIKENGPQKVKEYIPMSVYSTINSTTDAMKRNSPNLSTVNDAYRSTYDLGAKAVYAIKENGPQKVKEYIPSPETLKKLGHVLTHPATKEAVKLVPGLAPAYNIVGALLNSKTTDDSSLNKQKSELECNCNKPESPVSTFKKSTIAAETPEEVISTFITEGLDIKTLFDNQVVPARRKVTSGVQEVVSR